MTFSQVLDRYLKELGCPARALAAAAGVSPAVVSRCRTGARVPRRDSELTVRLAAGLAALSQNTPAPFPAAQALEALTAALEPPGEEGPLVDNLNLLIRTLDLSTREMAERMNYNASHLFRIRSGERRPAKPALIADGVCRYLLWKYPAPGDREPLARLMGCRAEELADDRDLARLAARWLLRGPGAAPSSAGRFLTALDRFDLGAFSRAARSPAPLPAVALPDSGAYYGLDGMKEAELVFLSAAAAGEGEGRVLLCADMPMEDMSRDPVFARAWPAGVAALLAAGKRLDVIHDVNRPLEEMLLGLEGWVPLYMTGRVTPWYFPSVQNHIYGHLTYSAPNAALEGECVMGSHAAGRYLFTRREEEVAYFRRRADDLLARARPLMDIYRGDRQEALEGILTADAAAPGPRRAILSSPPIPTLSAPLLDRILARSQVPPEQGEAIRRLAARQRALVRTLLSHSTITEEVGRLTPGEFALRPVSLSLSAGFLGADLRYTWEEYAQHLSQTAAFARRHPNYHLRFTPRPAFENIQLFLREKEWAAVAKADAPAVWFVIRHPKLRGAIESAVLSGALS